MGKASLQHWFDASPAWKCPRNCLTQACHEIWPRKLWYIRIQIRLLCWWWTSSSLQKGHSGSSLIWKQQIMWSWGWGEGGLHAEMAGTVVKWFWVATCNHNCWNSVAESFVKASYLARTRHAHQITAAVLHILQQSAFLFYVEFEPDHAVSSEQWETHMEIEQLQFEYWALVLDFQLCVLRFVHWVHCGDKYPCMQCLIKFMPWCFALDHVNYEMSNFELTQLLLPWSICCVENKIEETMWWPLWTTYPKLRNLAMNRFAELANKCAEKDANASRQLAAHSPVCMSWELSLWLSRVSLLERRSSANEVIIFNTVYN